MYVPRRCFFFYLVLCCFIFSRTGEVLGSRNDFKVVNTLNSPFPWKNDEMLVFWPCCECDCGSKINVLMYSTNQKPNCRVKVCIGVYCGKISAHSTSIVACSRDETELWLSPSVKQHWNPCSGRPAVHLTIWVHTMIGLLKKLLSICQSGWKEIRTHFWSGLVCWRPGTRILVLLCRRY